MKSSILPIVIVAIVIAGVAAFVLTTNPDTGLLQPTSSSEGIKKFSSYDEMTQFLSDNLGSSYGGLTKTTAEVAGAPAAQSSESRDVSATGTDYSKTNVQVEGVDEPDIVKNDGNYIYTASYNKIFVIDATPAEEMKVLSEIKFEDQNVGINNMFVSGDKLVVFANRQIYYLFGGVAESKIAMPIYPGPYNYEKPKAFIYVYDISDRSNPVLERNISVDGSYVDARMIGTRVYAIMNSPIGNVENVTTPVIVADGESKSISAPDIYYFPQPDYSYGFTSILSLDVANDQSDVSSRVILMGASQNIFVSEKNIYVAYQNQPNYYDYASALIDEVFVPNMPQDIVDDINKIKDTKLSKAAKFEAISSRVYDYLYNLPDDERSRIQKLIDERTQKIYEDINRESQKTIVHRIEINGGSIEYKATGVVNGVLLNQFSMDENNGYFRVATTTNNFNFGMPVPLAGVRTTAIAESGSSGGVASSGESTVAEKKPSEEIAPEPREPSTLNHVYVLDMDLKVVGKLENIAPDERIYSARFLGDRAYLVTFKQVDPFFVIDLSNPTDPKILGKLKIPGFSQYLHPYDENHVIGVGQETEQNEFGGTVPKGVKVSLFDVSDVSNPREVSKYVVGGMWSYSEALYDHKAFLFSKDKELIVIPVTTTSDDYKTTFQGAYVLSINLDDGIKLKGTIAHDTDSQWGSYVRRSLYIGDVLYTVSDILVKANNLSDLSEISKVELPVPEITPNIYSTGVGVVEPTDKPIPLTDCSGTPPTRNCPVGQTLECQNGDWECA